MRNANESPNAARRSFLKGAGYLMISFALPMSMGRTEAAPATGPPPVTGPGVDAGSQLVPKGIVDSFIAIGADGNVVAFNGHVDLGTGIRTAFTQIVADELYVPLERVSMVLGDTDRTPNQGPTIASASVQVSSVPMRRAAAQAREFLVQKAAARLNVRAESLIIKDGTISAGDGRAGFSYGELVEGENFSMKLSDDVQLKERADYTFVGKSVPRVDIPTKLTGGLIYVHDLRLPGMLHARIVRPPYAGRDTGDMVGNSLISVDKKSVSHISTLVDVVVIKDFVAVVAEREEDAIEASHDLKVQWETPPPLQDLTDLTAALRAIPDKVRMLRKKGNVETALKDDEKTLRATYVWPYQMHASIGPSCGVAEWKDEMLTIWSGSQNPHNTHSDVATLLGLPEENIRIVRMEASGCYGRNCADDATVEAALLAYTLKRPVRVQLMREEEHTWEPKGTAQLMEVAGRVTGKDSIAYEFTTRYPSNGSPVLPLLMTGVAPSKPAIYEMADRTAIIQYRCSDTNVIAFDTPPIVRASWLRGVAALPNVFAHESFIDELAAIEKADPVEFRLRFMDEPRPIELTKAVAERARWTSRPAPNNQQQSSDGILRGRGFSQHRYVHGAFPGVGASWSAWVVDIEIDPATGYILVKKVVVGQDSGLVVNPAGITHQVHGNVLQAISRTLKEAVSFDSLGVTNREWGTYPILTFPEVPEIDVVQMPDNGNPPLGAGEAASVPGPAAIANAVFDATGVRMREAPFTPERVKHALRARNEDQT